MSKAHKEETFAPRNLLQKYWKRGKTLEKSGNFVGLKKWEP